MRFGKELDQSLRILLVYAIISTVFEIIQKISPVIFFGSNHDVSKNFIEIYLLWFIVMFFIIVSLCIYIKKTDGKLNLTFLHNPMIRLTSGLLIIFEGIFNLSKSVPVAFSNIITFYPSTTEFEKTFGTSKEAFLVSCIVPSLINLIQLLLGLYFVLYKKHNTEKEHLN